MKKRFYIIRHGETEFNKIGMVQGSGIDSSLNETGRAQAAAFFQNYKEIPFDKIFVSSLKRTKESVLDFIAKGISIEVIVELNEISWGDFEGQPISTEMHQRYLDILSEWPRGNLTIAYNNAETPIQMQHRQRIALQKILEGAIGENFLIATHGRYLRAFLCLLLDHPLHLMDDFTHSNLCLYILDFDGEKFTMLEADNRNHLAK